MRNILWLLGLSLLGVCLTLVGFLPVYAASDSEDEFMLEEVTVTAEKREENVQKTAVSITAITGADIRDNAQVTLESVLRDVPALQIQKSPQGGQIFIRGVGANGDSNWVDPSIAITMDNVYSGRAESVFAGMYDLDRVEVLRGPQGTLYGRNATGGTINVITRNPGYEAEMITNFQAGNYNLLHFDGAANLPLVKDKLAFRLAALRECRDGYFSNGGMASNLTGIRGKLLFEPSEKLTVLLTGDYSNNDSLGTTTVPYEHTSGPPIFQWEIDPGDPWFVDPQHPADDREDTFKTVSLKVDYDFGWSVATLIPAYTHSSRFVVTDLIAGTTFGPLPEGTTTEEDQYTIEARLASPSNSDVKWVFGAYYLDTTNQPTEAQPFSSDYDTYGNNRPASSAAAFVQTTYPLTNRFRITGGLRYTYDKKSVDYGIRSIYGPLYDTGLQTAEDDYSAVTYKAGVEYDLKPENLIYAHVSTGYKAGGFNTSSMPPSTYDPETLTAFALGSKNRLFSDRVQINGEAYLYLYDKYQVQFPLQEAQPIPPANIPPGSPATQFAQYVANAETGENYGLDLEIKALLTKQDQVDINFAYQHARYGDLTLTPDTPPGSTLAPGEAFDLSDTEVANAPEWSGTLGYQHSFYLPNGGFITARAQMRISSGYWVTVEKHLENAYQESYTRSDANLSYTAPNETWFVSLWVKNIEDDYQKTSVMPLYRMTINEPRTYGINFTLRL